MTLEVAVTSLLSDAFGPLRVDPFYLKTWRTLFQFHFNRGNCFYSLNGNVWASNNWCRWVDFVDNVTSFLSPFLPERNCPNYDVTTSTCVDCTFDRHFNTISYKEVTYDTLKILQPPKFMVARSGILVSLEFGLHDAVSRVSTPGPFIVNISLSCPPVFPSVEWYVSFWRIWEIKF